MASEHALLSADGLCKNFVSGDSVVHALRDVSFEIYPGEFIVVLGPSGSGKSTMLNIIGGIEGASAGTVKYDGQDLSAMNSTELCTYRRKHVGFVFQFYNLMPGLSAYENVELAAELSTDPLDAKALIEKVGLAERAAHFPSEMSGGQQQRVAIARALAKNPDILLCDEPTGALDSTTGNEILRLLCDFNREYKKTVILITHNRDIACIADRIFYFKDGSLERITVNADVDQTRERFF